MTPREEFDPSASFCLFRIPKTGGRVIWEVTNTCNYGCRYCIFSSTSRQQKDELNTAKIFETIGALSENGFTHVKITGGEPFTRPDIMDILRHCCAAGLKTDISTNASLVTKEIAEELETIGLDMVHVSLDGSTQEMQEAVRGKRTWAPTLDGLKYLAATSMRVRAGCVVYKGNEDQLASVAAFCADQGCNEVIFSRMEPVGRMRGREELVSTLSNAELQARVATAADEVGDRIKVTGSFAEPTAKGSCSACPGGEKFLFIDHKGRVSPCTWVAERRPEYRGANTLHTHSLTEILAGAENRNFRKIAVKLHAAGLNRCPMQSLQEVDEARREKLFEGDMEANLKAGGRFSFLSPVYPFTTENIAGYLDKINLAGKSVLTVAGSGDQAVNAFAAGAADVTCFDLNYLSRHMMELKFVLLQALNFEDYKRFLMAGTETFGKAIYDGIKICLPVSSRSFWDSAYNAFGGEGALLRQSFLFKDNQDPRTAQEKASNALKNNTYLASPSAYRHAQQACRNQKVRFIQADVRELSSRLDRNFDVILLSNLSDYAHHMFPQNCLPEYRGAVMEPLAAKLTQGGTLAFGYVYDGRDLYGSKARSSINDPAARRAAFAHAGYAEIDIPSTIDADNHDTMLLWKAA